MDETMKRNQVESVIRAKRRESIEVVYIHTKKIV